MRYVSLAVVIGLAACSGGVPAAPPASSTASLLARTAQSASADISSGIIYPKGYHARLFVKGDASLYNPDPIVAQAASTYVAFQNATQPDGTGGDSVIVQYAKSGGIVQKIKVPGRCDGMRWNPSTNLMWLTVNEDANSSMYTWDPASGSVTHYAFSSAKHGGGYDDLAFANGKAFIAASNPALHNGKNTGPALVSVTLHGSTAEVTPVLYGDAKAIDIPTGKTVQLNLTDPDALTVAPSGDVVLVSQADSELVFIHNAGMQGQSVSRLLIGTQVDDTAYATASDGFFYVVDAKRDKVWIVKGPFEVNGLYTEAPSDSYVAGFVGKINQKTGTIRPLITGFGSPTGLVFVTE